MDIKLNKVKTKLDLQQQAHIEQNPSLLQQASKDEVEKIQQELFIIRQKLAKARIDQYGYIPNPDPWE